MRAGQCRPGASEKIGRMRRVKAHQSGRLYSLQSGWYHGSYTAFAPVLDGIVAVWRGKGRFSFPFFAAVVKPGAKQYPNYFSIRNGESGSCSGQDLTNYAKNTCTILKAKAICALAASRWCPKTTPACCLSTAVWHPSKTGSLARNNRPATVLPHPYPGY